MATQLGDRERDLLEQFERIRQMSADADARYQEALKIERERKVIPLSLLIQALIAGGALVGAGAALATILLRLS